MNRILGFLFIFLVSQAHSLPRDVIDEAKAQLEELKRIVQGDIIVAHDNLEALSVDFLTFVDTTVKDGVVTLQQEHETIWAQLLTIKELALQANKNISACTDIREEVLNKLPRVFTEQMVYCASGHDNETEKLLEDAKYIVDVSIGKVHELEHQLDRCGDAIQCIASVVNEIDLDMIRLPQNIKTEVEAVGGLVATLKTSVTECADVKIAEYSSDANSILQDITACVNRIM